VRFLVDLENKSDIGVVDWEFIHDMQGIAPDLITPEFIRLTAEFLEQIPAKWDRVKTKLEKHLVPKKTIHCGISDVENLGNEFKLRGILKNSENKILSYHKVVVYDEDKFQDDYIGAVITDKNGLFALSFGKKTFSDFNMEAEPDIYFKVFNWDGAHFNLLGKVTPHLFEKKITEENHIIYDFGVVTIDSAASTWGPITS